MDQITFLECKGEFYESISNVIHEEIIKFLIIFSTFDTPEVLKITPKHPKHASNHCNQIKHIIMQGKKIQHKHPIYPKIHIESI